MKALKILGTGILVFVVGTVWYGVVIAAAIIRNIQKAYIQRGKSPERGLDS